MEGPWKAFHSLIWQQRRERVRVGSESDGEAFACLSLCVISVCVHARVRMSQAHKLSLTQSHSRLFVHFTSR